MTSGLHLLILTAALAVSLVPFDELRRRFGDRIPVVRGEIHPDKTCFTGVPPKGKTAIYTESKGRKVR